MSASSGAPAAPAPGLRRSKANDDIMISGSEEEEKNHSKADVLKKTAAKTKPKVTKEE